MRLQNTSDLLKMQGVDFKEVKGFEELSDINKKNYEAFIVNFFNGLGLDSRATLFPLGIHWVEHNEHLTKDEPEDDYYIVCGSTIYSVDKEGNKTLHRKWVDEDYKESPVLKTQTSEYLRFEYEHQERKEWLHVIEEGKSWY